MFTTSRIVSGYVGGTPGEPGARPPRFAEHAQEILLALGFSPDESERLRSSGVVPAPSLSS